MTEYSFEGRLALGSLPGASLLLGYADPTQTAISAFTAVNGHEFCGVCRLCRRCKANSHPELIISNDISMDEARRLVISSTRRTSELDTRVIAITGYRMKAFQNAMLKLLEEPGPNRILWFGDNSTQFLETVLSRCEVFRGPIVLPDWIDPESTARAIEFIDASKARKLLQIATLADVWEDPIEVLREIARLLLEESVHTGNMGPYDAAVDVHSVARRGRPSANAVKSISDAIIKGV